ncbi:hypothetical protein [Paenibacillus dendritiformis]
MFWRVVLNSRGSITYAEAGGMSIEELCEAAAAMEWMYGTGGGQVNG